MPGSASEAVVKCTGCAGQNVYFEDNNGLPTVAYRAPIVDHVGRLVDSSTTVDVRNGFRTARAGKIRIAKTTRGSAPPRAYIGIGEAVGVYSLDTFFSTTLPAPMVGVHKIFKGVSGRDPAETIAKFDAYIYPETPGSGWTVSTQDKQGTLGDFDFDDRGYVYGAFTVFGWGIMQDDGRTGATHLPTISQTGSSIVPYWIFAIRSGNKYYAAISARDADAVAVYDVTNPAAPVSLGTRQGDQWGIDEDWTKDTANNVIAYLCGDGKIRIWDNDDYASGLPANTVISPSTGRGLESLTFDEAGNLWVAEATGSASANILRRYSRSGGTYVETQYPNVFGGNFSPYLIAADGGHIVVAGKGVGPTGEALDVRLIKREGGTPRNIDLHNFFLEYYHRPPQHYAQPSHAPKRYVVQRGVQVMEWRGKTYIIYNIHGMGDVYQVEGNDTILASMSAASYGTTNPHARPTQTGPFPGDVVSFTAASSNPAVPFTLSWEFGNPEAGTSSNLAQANTGQTVKHQYTNLPTSTAILSAKVAKATAVNDNTVTDAVTVNLKVPTARVGLSSADTLFTTSGASLSLLAGDGFVDASDGSVESHVANWTIDGTPTKRLPGATQPAGSIGAHTLSFTGSYGRYDATTLATGSAPYVTPALALTYTVRPFMATLNTPTKSGGSAHFTATGRKAADTSVITATSWTYTWTATNTVTAVAPASGTATPPAIPAFDIPESALKAGTVVTLTLVVASADLSPAALPFATFTDSITLTKPDPKIVKSGCANALGPCSFTASSIGSQNTSNWVYSWTLKKGTATIKTGTGNPFEPAIADPGNYKAFLTVTAPTTIFDGTAETAAFDVEGVACGPLPAAANVSITTNCSSCKANEDIQFRPGFIGYTSQACDSYLWSFGDGTTSTSKIATHKYTTNKTYTVTLKVTNATGSVSVLDTVKIGGSDDPPPPPPPSGCNAATTVSFSWSGNKGCKPGTACKTGESVRFTATKNNLALQLCDSATWTFGDGTSSAANSPAKTFSTPDTYPVTVVVSNEKGDSSPVTLNVSVVQDTGSSTCSKTPTDADFYIDYEAPSGCNADNGSECLKGEAIQFHAKGYFYTFQSCDKFEWNFGDGTTSTEKEPKHTFTGPAPSSHVTLRVWNSLNTTGSSVGINVPFPAGPTEPVPTITVSGPSTTGKGATVTFTANASLNATGWSWNFGDGSAKDNSQAGIKSTSSTVSHVFTKTGKFSVTVTAKNANDTTERSTGTGLLQDVVVSETPVYRYLLPAVIHDNGQNGSLWRTDVQVYYGAPSPSAEPLSMTAEFAGKSVPLTINQATFIYEDFVSRLATGNASGSVIITTQAKYKPQLWTRTYNVDPSGKTFGQFIPAIELTGTTAGAVEGSADPVKYYLSGLRANTRYRTNVGFINTSAGEIIADVTAYDDLQNPLKRFAVTLPQYELKQISLSGAIANVPNRPISLEISIPTGKSLVAYASFIDGASNDPVYISATAGTELASADYATSITPGVGHIGAWRSDVTVFNPDDRSSVTFDLEYYDADGLRRGAARNVTLGPLQSKNYEDLLHVTEVFSPAPPDGVGMLKLRTFGTPARYPLTFSRTYNDKGAGGTFGQGIPGFAAARANVKPGKVAIIPGVRSNTSYKTNIGLTNTSSNTVDVRVQLLDPNTGAVASEQTYRLYGDASIVATYPFGSLSTGTLKVEIVGGEGGIWAFASVIDLKSEDPEYVPAFTLP